MSLKSSASGAGFLAVHSVCAAALLTSAVMLASASELGVYGPIFIALGLYTICFAVLTEAFLLARHVAAALRSLASLVLGKGSRSDRSRSK